MEGNALAGTKSHSISNVKINIMNWISKGSCILFLAASASREPDLKKEEAEIGFVWRDWSKKALTGKPDSIAWYFA